MMESAKIRPESVHTPYIEVDIHTALATSSFGPETTPVVIKANTEGTLDVFLKELAKKIRERNIRNPLIYYSPDQVLTGTNKAAFLDAGGDAVIDKTDIGEPSADPNKDAVLVRIAQSLTESTQQRIQGKEVIPYEFGLAFNPALGRFSVNGTPISLTSMQTEILKTFLRLRAESKGRPINATMLAQAVYGIEKPDTNVLAANIGNMNRNTLRPKGISLNGSITGGYQLKEVRS